MSKIPTTIAELWTMLEGRFTQQDEQLGVIAHEVLHHSEILDRHTVLLTDLIELRQDDNDRINRLERAVARLQLKHS